MANNKCLVTVVLGAQWGDEGKGKIVDYLIDKEHVDVTARCQGGNNAGHTVKVGGHTYDFHLLPSGIISENCHAVIGNGVVVHMDALFDELEHNHITQLKDWEKRLIISENAHLVCKVHTLVDTKHEEALAIAKKIGTTNRGIGPTYASKCFRNGVRVGDLIGDFDRFVEKYTALVEHYRKLYPSLEIDIDKELAQCQANAEKLRRLNIVGDTIQFLDEKRSAGKKILVEGANGALLDIDFGTYPNVTSSNSTIGGVCTGLGLPASAIGEVIGVVKAYQTRVGTGPFPTELINEIGDDLQRIGKEFGVTTGRKRRCGWLDLVLLKRSHVINGFTALALTKLDILNDFAEIQIATAYKMDNQNIVSPPVHTEDWSRIEVVYETFAGWQMDISNIRKYAELPENCRKMIEFIEQFIQVPVRWIGVGQDRLAIIIR